MSERKWIEVVDYGTIGCSSYHVVKPVHQNGCIGTPVPLLPAFLRDEPEGGGGWDSPWHKAERNRANRLQREWEKLRHQVAELDRELSNRQPASDSLRVERERDALRRDLENARASLVTTSDQLGLAQDQRDEAQREAEELRSRVAELERDVTDWQHAEKKACEKRDEARREAEELRAENERLREPRVSACPECGSSLCFDPRYGQLRWADPSDDQPAPQTKYKPGDVVDVGWSEPVRLHRFRRLDGHDRCEHWETDYGGFVMRSVDLLERDGTPTDAGLRRLAEKAGCKFYPVTRGSIHTETAAWEEDEVYLAHDATANDRRALAAALREMGGA